MITILATTPVNQLFPIDFATTVARLLTEHNVPGLSLAAFSGEMRESLAAGVLNIQTQSAITNQTVFPCASLSKPVTAYMALKLVGDGMLDLDKAVGLYRTGIRDLEDPEVKLLSLRQLLCHRSGLPNWRKPGELLRLRVKTDSRFMYSGEAYLLAQRLMEAVTGAPFTSLAQNLVFDPLNMRNSAFTWREEFRTRVVAGHDQQLNCAPAQQFAEPNAAYSLLSTSEDYLQFILALRDSKPLLASMRMPEIAIDADVAWGLGWSLAGSAVDTCLWHIGDLVQFVSLALYLPDRDKGFVCTTNSQNGRHLCEILAQNVLGDVVPVARWIESFFGTFSTLTAKVQ